jgi:prepilin-type N-terminal cleavage/methylation domain-containing protein
MKAPVRMLRDVSYLRGTLKKLKHSLVTAQRSDFIAGIKAAAGFSLIELTVVILIMSLLFVAAAERFLFWEERAEKAAMESVLAGAKMGLQIRMAEMIITNSQSGLTELQKENPMRWLQEHPTNYVGEYPAQTQPGNWYYESKRHELVYVPHSTSHLTTSTGRRELRFKVAVRYDSDRGSDNKSVIGVAVTPTDTFAWF